MIAGNDGNVLRTAQGRKPALRLFVFARQTDIGKITGHCNVIDILQFEICDHSVRDGTKMCMAPASPPVSKAKRSLDVPVPRPKRRQGRQVNIRDVSQREAIGHLLDKCC